MQGCKERATESGRKGGEEIFSGPLSLAGDTEEEGVPQAQDPPWGTRGLSHILGSPALGHNTRKMSPLSWCESQWG